MPARICSTDIFAHTTMLSRQHRPQAVFHALICAGAALSSPHKVTRSASSRLPEKTSSRRRFEAADAKRLRHAMTAPLVATTRNALQTVRKAGTDGRVAVSTAT